MNEAIAAVICADTYTDALTLGPFPTIADSVDVTVQAAGVFAQLFRNVDTGVQSLGDREYLLLPGSRTINNVTGIRFRNQIPGVPAIVTASLGGPDLPQIGPIFADTPLVGAPLFVPQQVKLDGGGTATPFTGIPPAGYGALLIYAQAPGGATPAWLFVENQLPGGIVQRQQAYLSIGPGLGIPSYWVVTVPAATISVGFLLGVPNTSISLGVWPTNLAPGTYLPPIAGLSPSPVLYLADGLVIPNGVTLFDVNRFFVGPGKVVLAGGTIANVSVMVNLLDTGGNRLGFEFRAPLTDGVQDILLNPGRHQIEWINTTGVNQTVSAAIIGQYGGLTQ